MAHGPFADVLTESRHLGHGVDLSFEHIDFVLTAPSGPPHELWLGQFLIALVAADTHGPGEALVLSSDRLVVLRAQTVLALTGHPGGEVSPWTSQSPRQALLRCEVVGCFEPPDAPGQRPCFSSTFAVGHAAARHHLFLPGRQISELLCNATVASHWQIEFGYLRSREDRAYLHDPLPVRISMQDIQGKRTAMFGKTRLGKSNVVKLIAQGILDVTADAPKIGQLIFDVNGEYANSNPQDGDTALAHVYASRCHAYFLTDLSGNPNARLLRFNFFERAHDALEVLYELLPEDVRQAPELRNLFTCRIPRVQRLETDNDIETRRRLRKVFLFWSVLASAGFEASSDALRAFLAPLALNNPFNPGFTQGLRAAAYQEVLNKPPPSVPFSFESMAVEMRVVARFANAFRNDPSLNPHGQYVFDTDEDVLNALLSVQSHALDKLRPCLMFHSPLASNFTQDILNGLNEGKTVIINLGSANENILRYFAKSICTSIFHEQERKFISNTMGDHYIQVYFEEAHNIFPAQGAPSVNVYSRFAKEGAKFHIGIVYCTQSPTSVSQDLLSQTENFFIGHLSCRSEAEYLADVQQAFSSCVPSILRNRTPGYIQMLTFSHRYVVPVMVHRYTGHSRVC